MRKRTLAMGPFGEPESQADCAAGEVYVPPEDPSTAVGECRPPFCEEGKIWVKGEGCFTGEELLARNRHQSEKSKGFDWSNPGSWFSTISATGETSEPVFVPQGEAPPAGSSQVAPPVQAQAQQTPISSKAATPTPESMTAPPPPAEEPKTSPLVWVALAGAVALGGWFVYKNMEKSK